MSKDKKPGLSKKELAALQTRELELRVELEKRAAKKAAKKAAKADVKKAAKVATKADADTRQAELDASLAKVAADAKAERKKKREQPEPEAVVAAAEAVLDGNSSDGAKESAHAALERIDTDALDAEIKARLRSRLSARQAELDVSHRDMQHETEKRQADKHAAREADVVEKVADAVEALKSAVDEIETETGRVFEASTPSAVADDDFAKPSEAPRNDFEVNGNGQYKVKRPSDGKLVGYTRVTTYIDTLEDKSMLTRWKMRLTLEGVAAADADETREPITTAVRDLVHNRDVKIAKARKADRKGKLGIGELASYVNGAWADFKKGLDALADDAFEIGGGREKATKGTDIHALCDLHDREGIDAVGELLTNGEITPADMADVEAYAAAMAKLGAKVVEAERVVVNDELKVAGRLDRVVMVKLPGELRARRRVLDIKTGRVDLGAGKIAQQIEMYSGCAGYDLVTHEREDLKLDRTKGILLHLPAGEASAHAYVVDLVAGRKGNKLSGDVRAWRNEGKRSIDLKTDLLEGEASA